MENLQKRIRIILIDDHETIHQEIGGLLSALDDVALVAQGYNGEEAIDLCEQHQPDVVLMDISMPVMNGINATRSIVSRQPEIKIIALSGRGDMETVLEMINAGAVGYVLKDTHPEELESTIRAVHSGKSVFSTEVFKPLLNQASITSEMPRDYGLTRRELEVLQAMALGLNNNEVAYRLNISTATVRFHLTNIVQKLGAETRTEALVIAARQKLI